MKYHIEQHTSLIHKQQTINVFLCILDDIDDIDMRIEFYFDFGHSKYKLVLRAFNYPYIDINVYKFVVKKFDIVDMLECKADDDINTMIQNAWNRAYNCPPQPDTITMFTYVADIICDYAKFMYVQFILV